MKIVKEHINFERGLDPKEAMEIGRLKEIIIEKITKSDPENWQGSSVLAKYLTRRGKYPIGWDIPMLEDESIQKLKYALEYLEKWERVDKKHLKTNETISFQRGLDPKRAMQIGKYRPIDFSSPYRFAEYLFMNLETFTGLKPDRKLVNMGNTGAFFDTNKTWEAIKHYYETCPHTIKGKAVNDTLNMTYWNDINLWLKDMLIHLT
jgi:hypothetical protein